MIDTHAHLNFSDFDKDLEEVLVRSWEKGIENIIVVGSDLQSSKKSIRIAEEDSRIKVGIGIHPQDIAELNRFDQIEKLARLDQVVAIGETGLDYYRLDNDDNKQKQKELFELHIALAKEIKKPLIFHCREAEHDFLNTVQKLNGSGVLHCFTGNWGFAKKILDFGFKISFTGIITFTKDQDLLEVVKKIPLEKIMVETDCPFLAPPPYRGKRCEPFMVSFIIDKIADLKKIPREQVAETTTVNARNFFGLW